MKTLTLMITLLLILTFFGCMENQLTQPESLFDNSVNKVSSNITSTCLPVTVNKGEIKLCCGLNDPMSGNCHLLGCVVYMHTTLSNIGGFARIQIKFDMKSELITRMMHIAPYTITGCSCDTVYLNEMGVAFIEKNYEVENRPDIRMGLKYKVMIDQAEVISVRLQQIDE